MMVNARWYALNAVGRLEITVEDPEVQTVGLTPATIFIKRPARWRNLAPIWMTFPLMGTMRAG